MVRKEDSRMLRSVLELEMGLKGTTSEDEVKGGVRGLHRHSRIFECEGE